MADIEHHSEPKKSLIDKRPVIKIFPVKHKCEHFGSTCMTFGDGYCAYKTIVMCLFCDSITSIIGEENEFSDFTSIPCRRCKKCKICFNIYFKHYTKEFPYGKLLRIYGIDRVRNYWEAEEDLDKLNIEHCKEKTGKRSYIIKLITPCYYISYDICKYYGDLRSYMSDIDFNEMH